MNVEIFINAVPAIVSGLWLTVIITVFSFVVGQVAALPIALAATSSSWLLRAPARTYIFAIRGSPLLVQLFIVYYGLGEIDFIRNSLMWSVLRDPLNCAVLCIGLNSAAYVGNILRGAILQVPRGHREAAQTLGLSNWHTLSRIVLPQVYRSIGPLLANELVLVLKASSLAGVVTVMEMTGAAKTLVARTYAPFEVFIAAGVFYLAIGMVISGVFWQFERWTALPGSTAER